MQPLVEAGYVAFAYGGAEQGKFLCHHKLVEKVHLTGSASTYDAIVWGGKSKVRYLKHLDFCLWQRDPSMNIIDCLSKILIASSRRRMLLAARHRSLQH